MKREERRGRRKENTVIENILFAFVSRSHARKRRCKSKEKVETRKRGGESKRDRERQGQKEEGDHVFVGECARSLLSPCEGG